MNFPLISEYIEAIKSADNFRELNYLRPVLGDNGLPVMTSGNFAVVFKMKDERDGKLYALKCFTKEQEGRAEAYREITKELQDVSSPYLVSIQFLEKELFVDTDQTTETEFPVLLMDWVEGKTLDKYLRENLDDKFTLEMLAYRFSLLAQWLIPQPFAHGDLKPDNILVRENGSLVLVDYDGMYVPAMKGQKARELGSPDFRHPHRTENDFNNLIDDFPLVIMLLSLKAISINPNLIKQNNMSNRLLFSKQDFLDISGSNILKDIFPSSDIEINRLMTAFLHYVLNSSQSRYPVLSSLNSGYSPSITNYKDKYILANKYIDDYGVIYTADKKYLIKWRDVHATEIEFPKSYRIQEGTEVICDDAFMFCKNLTSIFLPKSLRYLGSSVFVGTKVSNIICESSLFDVEDNILYSYDRKVIYYYPEERKGAYFEVPSEVKKIIPGCFSTARYLWVIKFNHLIFDFHISSTIFVSIPKGTKKYLNNLFFSWESNITKTSSLIVSRVSNVFEGDLVVDNGVIYSADRSVLYRFPYWLELEEYRVDDRCKIIEVAAFEDGYGYDEKWGSHIQFNKLKKLYLPHGLIEIKDYAFVGCGLVENLTIPQSVETIGNYVFGQCINLMTLTFLSTIRNIGKFAFHFDNPISAPLVNPNTPWVDLSYNNKTKCDVDIIICPNGTDDYYRKVIVNDNSLFLVLEQNEKQIEKNISSPLNDVDYFKYSASQIKSITTYQLLAKARSIVLTTEKSFGKGYKIDIDGLKTLLSYRSFKISKPTSRFIYRQHISGICYIAKNYQTYFIFDDICFDSFDDAIDYVCRIYYNAYGNVLDLDFS